MNRSFVKTVINAGGRIVSLMISPKDSNGLGLCNPSIFLDGKELWCILRNVNYTVYHAENNQVFNNRWGPLSYLNPENDLHLRTWNFLLKINPDLSIAKYWKIDTSQLDKEPLWEFVGLEDARLVRWDGKLFAIGCRRDTTTNGQSRMELSRLKYDEKFNRVKEIARYRIEHPTDPNWYCEKNWMPIIDMPYHFVKFTNPVEVVKCDLHTLKSWRSRDVDESMVVPGLPFLRGSSQVIPWNNFRICLVHEVDLTKNYLDQKDATYRHRFVVWDRDWNLIKITEPFSFMGGELEFCCGLAIYDYTMLVSFGFQDNCAFILQIPDEMISQVLEINKLDWGIFAYSPTSMNYIANEVISQDVYQREYRVQEGDVVLDVGASIGPFVNKIKDSKPSRVVAIEPDIRLISALKKNCLCCDFDVHIIEKGIAAVDGKVINTGLFSNSDFYKDSWEGVPTEIDGIKFKTVIDENAIGRIDFLKTDCEGGEYDIFNDENIVWIRNNVKQIAGEFHLHNDTLNQKWLHFRDTYLKLFPKFSIYSLDGFCITESVWDDSFAKYYKAIMLYINNSIIDKWRSTQYPTLEITTIIPTNGCPNHCVYCPQDNLAVAYDGVKSLSYENFVHLLAKVPKEVQITFAGFCEPFVNPNCADMIQYAHSKGHKVSVFTTGVGMTIQDLEQIHTIPFAGIQGGFVLHLPDCEGYFVNKHNTDYMELLAAIKQTPLSNFQTVTMGTLNSELQELFPNTIRQTMYSRAENLKRSDVFRTRTEKGATCGCRERLYHNVLLPNGDVALCCMDYSLKHVIGNLYQSDYEEIVPVDGTPFELCKHCENGVAL